MEISSANKVSELKEKGVNPLCSIWIVHEEKEESFDINVWDEIENERDEEIEENGFQALEEAQLALTRIIEENLEVTFVRLPNEINTN